MATGVVAACLAVLVVPLHGSAQTLSRDIHDYVLLGGEKLRLKNFATISGGHVGVIEPGGQLRFGKSVFMGDTTQAVGDRVFIRRDTSLCEVFANDVRGSDFDVRCFGPDSFVPPLLSLPPLPFFVPGTTDIKVEKGAALALPPGAYGRIRVNNDAQLTLAGGTYDVASLHVGRRAALVVEAPATLNVETKLKFGNQSVIVRGPGVFVPDLRFNVGSPSGGGGRKLNGRILLGADGDYSGDFFAPLGLVRLGRDLKLIGQAVALLIGSDHSTTIDPPACRVRLTALTGGVKNEVGNFGPEPDPHQRARLFIDKVAGGNILANPDEQNVVFELKVSGAAAADPAKYEIAWEVRDPDDPAEHKDVDPNDGGTPTGGTSRGGDNIDAKPEETTDGRHFLREAQAAHAISGRDSPGSDPTDPTKVIGKATTQLDANARSSVRFHYGDEGGDNYILTAFCVEKGTGTRLSRDGTNVLTVWRKRSVVVQAMKDGDDVQAVAFGAATAAATTPVITAGVDGALQTTESGDDVLDAANDRILAGPNQRCDTHAKSFYPASDGTLATVLTTLRTGYANPDPDHRIYVDFVVAEGTVALPQAGALDRLIVGAGSLSKYLQDNLHGGGNAHPDNTYDVVGVDDVTAVFGTARQMPHVVLSRTRILDQQAGGDDDIAYNIIHELGHALFADSPFHDGHTDGDFQDDCAFETGTGHGTEVCEKHALAVRKKVSRSFPDHDAVTVNYSPSAMDSD